MIPEDFQGAAIPRTDAGLASCAKLVDCDIDAIKAVIDIETAGSGFLADKRPKILCERHYFSELTERKFDAKYPQISNVTPGGYVGGVGEYDRLGLMMSLDREAALKSTSWGLPQIMGSNYALAAFDTVDAMVEAFCMSEDLQLSAMASFIVRAGLDVYLQTDNFTDFARRYNGPNYAANGYDRKLLAEFSRLKALAGAGDHTGWSASRIRTAKFQTALNVEGYGPLIVDGWLGPKTMAALSSYQNDNHLSVTGYPDAPTSACLLTVN